jgi:hypothetical protein
LHKGFAIEIRVRLPFLGAIAAIIVFWRNIRRYDQHVVLRYRAERNAR